MVADLFSLLAQTASPKGEAGKGRIAQSASTEREAGKRRIAQSASTERKTEKGTKDSRGVGKGKAGKRLVRRLVQTSSVCLRRQLPRRGKPRKGELRRALLPRGKPRKGELRRALLQRGKPRKKRKTAEASEREKRRGAGTIPRRAGIKIDEVYIHIRLRIRGNRFRKAIL